MNKHWPVDTDRFGRIVITDDAPLPTKPTSYFVNFSLVVNRPLVQAISGLPFVMSHIGTSSNIEEISFASTRPLIKRIAVRQALSWSINRQALIDQLWGAVTFSPSVAVSALFSQGQADYPGPTGHRAVGPDDHDDARAEYREERPRGLPALRPRRLGPEWLRSHDDRLDDRGRHATGLADGGRSQ